MAQARERDTPKQGCSHHLWKWADNRPAMTGVELLLSVEEGKSVALILPSNPYFPAYSQGQNHNYF